jgi:hypothetical protein
MARKYAYDWKENEERREYASCTFYVKYRPITLLIPALNEDSRNKETGESEKDIHANPSERN